MTNGRVEVITSVERRRRWSSAEKQQLVATSLEAGASVSEIARQAGIHASQLYGWRRALRAKSQVGFAPVRISPEVVPAGPGTIEIEFASGARMRVTRNGVVAAAETGCNPFRAALEVPLGQAHLPAARLGGVLGRGRAEIG